MDLKRMIFGEKPLERACRKGIFLSRDLLRMIHTFDQKRLTSVKTIVKNAPLKMTDVTMFPMIEMKEEKNIIKTGIIWDRNTAIMQAEQRELRPAIIINKPIYNDTKFIENKKRFK